MQQVALAAVFASALAGFAPSLPPHIDVKLIAESIAPRAGHTQFVGFQMTPQPGWHGYWSNPGEVGLAPAVKWTAPEGVRFGPLQHPAPTLLEVQGMTSFVHAGPHVLISRMTLDRDLQPGTALPITAKISWAACSDKLCVSERATLTVQMTIGAGASSADAVTLHRALAAEPKAASAGSFQTNNGKLILQLPRGAELDARHARFFPDENGVFDTADARVISALPLRIEGPVRGPVPARISGVVSGGSAAFRLSFKPGELVTPQPEAVPQAPPAREVNSPRPSREKAPAPLVDSSRNHHRTPTAWVRLAEAALAALLLSSAAILSARRRRK